MWKYILEDLNQSILNYLPIGVIIGFIVTYIIELIFQSQSEIINKKKILLRFLLVAYIVAIFEIAFFSRESGSRNSINLVLFSTFGQDALSRSYVIENIIMSLPFGFLTPYFISHKKKFFVCISYGTSISITIELLQLISKRGYCQLDDVIMNILGTIIGYVIYQSTLLIYDIITNNNWMREESLKKESD